MSFTMNDIAKQVGVSKQTVSAVLNKKKSPIAVSEATRTKIMAIVKEHNYRPNYLAQNLKKKKSFLLGVYFPRHYNIFEMYYMNQILSGTNHALRNSDYQMVMINPEDKHEKVIDNIRSRRLDGLIFIVFGDYVERFIQTDSKLYLDNNVPLVGIHAVTRVSMNFNNVGYNGYQAGYLGTAHLTRLGHKKIGFVSLDMRGGLPFKEVMDGYQQALKDNNIQPDDNLIYFGDNNFSVGYDLVKKVQNKKSLPDAFYCFNDYLAINTIRGLEEIGLRVPEDIAVVSGHDNSEIMPVRQLMVPETLTTTRHQLKKQGRAATEMLIHHLENGKDKKPRSIIIEPELIIRKSCGGK